MQEKQIAENTRILIDNVRDALDLRSDINETDNLLELGLSSIQIMKLSAGFRKHGLKGSFVELISNPTIGAWKKILLPDSREMAAWDNKTEDIVKDVKKDMYQPFDLTDVQHAYWIGRSKGQYLGGVGCHGYLEIDGSDIDAERLNQAFYRLQQHHPMLRARITSDGRQQVMKEPYRKDIVIYDYRKQDAGEHLLQMREQLSHRLLDIYAGQVVCLQLTLLPKQQYRLHFDIDLLIADVTSFQLVLQDLVCLYNGRKPEPSGSKFNFAQYLYDSENANRQKSAADRKYWQQRIPDLPGKPELPIKSQEPKKIKFTRRQRFLEPDMWTALKQNCQRHQLTPAMVLLTVYGKVIARFSETPRFLMNIPLFNRSSDYGNIDNAVADFTTLLLMEFDFTEQRSFLAEVRQSWSEFKQGMSHITYSGVQVQRDYMKAHPHEKTVAPVVYSCNLGMPLINKECQETFGDISYMISQTPQVWLDFQLFDMNDGLLMIWDGIDELFPAEFIEVLFDKFQELLYQISGSFDWNSEIAVSVDEQLKVRKGHETVNDEDLNQLIHTAFFKKAVTNPDEVALVDGDGEHEITYRQLRQEALRIAGSLKQAGMKKGDIAGICLKRGKEQIASILGILAAGGTYVTVGIHQPLSRKRSICSFAGIKYILADQEEDTLLPEQLSVIDVKAAQTGPVLPEPENVSADSLAYIIFTSGSTGEPKGVMIRHAAAANTIRDINRRFKVGKEDAVLAVSAMDFDLSVYDVFGLLSVGGKVVLLPQGGEKNAAELLRRVNRHNVTVYNSVPALLDLFLLMAEEQQECSTSLRLALVSGDWIPLGLPERFYRYAPNGSFISLGGATEGSIWSNYYAVNMPLDKEWKSIPYGFPLTNQKFRVVDNLGQDCPDWVCGELWIGGAGVADGYVGNEQETERRFVVDLDERWYRTGDYGRFWPDGIMEFLGRKDHQIKIRGHRIETEEIEKQYLLHEQIGYAVVLPVGEEKRIESLAAFIVPAMVKASGETDRYTSYINAWKALRLPSKVKAGESEQELRSLAAECIVSVLLKLGVTAGCQDTFSLSGPSVGERIDHRYVNLVQQWIELLIEEQIIQEVSPAMYRNLCDLRKVPQNSSLPSVRTFVKPILDQAAAILTGVKNPVEAVYQDDTFSVETFANSRAGAEEKNSFLRQLVDIFTAAAKAQQPEISVMILGARNVQNIKQLLESQTERNIKFCIVDHSLFHLHKLESILGSSPDLNYQKITEPEWLEPLEIRVQYDAIIAFDFLHQFKNLDAVLRKLKHKIKHGGLLAFTEITENSAIQLVSTSILEEGYHDLNDRRKGRVYPLLSREDWLNCLTQSGYHQPCCYQPVPGIKKQAVFTAFQNEGFNAVDTGALHQYIKQCVPEYMVPGITVLLDEIPVTANGKTDRKKLLEDTKTRSLEKKETLPEKDLDQKLASIWCEVLNLEQLYLEDDFYLLGGDSLLATKIKIRADKELKTEVPLDLIFKYPVFQDYAASIGKLNNDKAEQKRLPNVTYQPMERYEPFPLTDVQQSYWIGQNGGYELGDVSSHCYFEMDCSSLDIGRLEDAWNNLIINHEMMRTVILPDGSGQKVLPKVSRYHIEHSRCEDVGAAAQESYFADVRRQMAAKVYDSSAWPLFELCCTVYGENRSRLHMSFDNIVFDGFSIFHLFAQWKRIYEDEPVTYCRELTFRDYVLTLDKIKETGAYQEDLAYWKDRASILPPAPQLPLADKKTGHGFQRFEFELEKPEWQKIAQIAEMHHLTLAVVFMAAYAEVLARYSKKKHFTINLTRFQKLPLDPEVENLIGDFTTLTLLEVDHNQKNSFLDRCIGLREQLHRDMAHSLVSGVEVERELTRQSGQNGVTMPVVFTSGFGLNDGTEGGSQYFGSIIYGESQTPQVWLDHQISVQDGKLFLSWDAVPGMFPEGLVADMFNAYKALVYQLMDNENVVKTASSLIAVPQTEQIETNNRINKKFERTTLADLFKRAAAEYPDHTAVRSSAKNLTYRELDRLTGRIARGLVKKNAVNQPVAIIMEKGYEQVAAAIAILRAGAVYLPIDAHNPPQRIRAILQQSGAALAITDHKTEPLNIASLANVNCFSCEQLSADDEYCKLTKTAPDDDAYIIFTSGSTGLPKGVVISHAAALNTILDINERFQVTDKDSTIFLSNLNFDLSVYDIFGMLTAGGTIVIPDYEKCNDPEHWIDLIINSNVTIWNSVPAFMQMLMEYQTSRKPEIYNKIRLILLSGDWIPVALPEKIRMQLGNAELIALGGATEASIWSNMFPIPPEVPNDWKSIPYGKPLTNQGFLILNEDMDRTPVWVPGELYIYGDGLARCYINDPVKTNESFIRYESENLRIYKTGDWGRYLPDGNIQFMGRLDNQIKRGGHRIELGEIEAQINNLDGVKEAVVTFISGDDGSLTANIIPDPAGRNLIVSEIRTAAPISWQQLTPGPDERTAYEQYKDTVEQLGLVQICNDMARMGLFDYFNTAHKAAAAEKHFAIDARFSGLFKNYLDAMVKAGLLIETTFGCQAADDWQMTLSGLNRSLSLNDEQQQLAKELRQSQAIRFEVLTGKREARELLLYQDTPFLFPERLRKYDSTGELFANEMFRVIKKWSERNTGTVMEIGSRIGNHTNRYAALLNTGSRYIYTDESLSYLEQKQAELMDSRIEFAIYHPGGSGGRIAPHSMAMIIADNTLHRFHDLHTVLERLRELLIPGGMLVILENTINSALMLETTAYFEEGYSNLTDDRAARCLPLIEGAKWQELAARHHYEDCQLLCDPELERQLGKNIMIMTGPLKIESLNEEYIRKALQSSLPDYMIPVNYVIYHEFPLTANGKVNRRKMKEAGAAQGTVFRADYLPETVIEKQFAAIWEELLNCQKVSLKDGFFELGGDSLKAIHFINRVKTELGYEVTLQTITTHPVLEDLIAEILTGRDQNTDEDDVEWEEIEEII